MWLHWCRSSDRGLAGRRLRHFPRQDALASKSPFKIELDSKTRAVVEERARAYTRPYREVVRAGSSCTPPRDWTTPR